MSDRRSNQEPEETIIVRRRPWARAIGMISLGILVLLAIAIALVWVQRRPIATEYLKREFERRGVQATYSLDRVGFRTQEVSNLVIGDPLRPDLIARYAQIQMRLKWNGSFEVYRIVARGVRLRGRLTGGRVRFGQVDKLLPPPSDKPFQLPNFVLDVADSSIALVTPFGPVGVALQGSGRLSGGFKGRAALTSPRLVPGRCAATNVRANVAVAVVARRPGIDGPVTLDRFVCPASRFDIAAPRFDATASFNESFTRVDGRGRMAIQTLVAGANGLSAFAGELTYKGPLEDVRGEVRLSARQSRLGTIYADRTRLDGAYRLGAQGGTFSMVGDVAANSARLDESMLAAVNGPLAAAASTPLGPITTAIGDAIKRTVRNFDATGTIRVVNFPGGGAARIDTADVRGPGGARARVAGGTGITYYWPQNGLRIDGNIEMGGGGLPSGRVSLRQAKVGGPMSGVAEIAPYSARGQRLALTPIRFGPLPGGATAVSTTAQLDGPFPDGRVQALRVPISGRVGQGGSFAFGTTCQVVSFDLLQIGTLRLDRSRLPVCPVGPAIISKAPNGPVLTRARVNSPYLGGRLGNSPFTFRAAGAQITGDEFAASNLNFRLGRSATPLVIDANRLTGSFAGVGTSGNFAGARSTIGNVPILLSDASGRWYVKDGDIRVNAAGTVSDRDANPRFYPLRGDDLQLTLIDGLVRANGALRHPPTGTRVADVSIEHSLAAQRGHADLNVPGITFGPGLQPSELTRLTESVIALVRGTVTGQGRIDWAPGGRVTSTGEFSTAGMDLAAPFGPVTGLATTVRFTDLLKLETAPNQVATIGSINPGILVENGTLRYQLLPNKLVRIERGEWPFMGGRLILQETVINFARPTAKRLTFEVVGLDANTFVRTLNFPGLQATGTFDGVLPMIFDEDGGRIVGGRLDSRPGGGSLAYVGEVNRANLGTMGNIAFNALRDLRFESMIIRLDGDLAGEFAARLAIEGVAIGQSTSTQRFIRGLLARIPLKLNVNITGPFRALIATAKSIRDPRQVIGDVLPRPLEDIPGIATEVRRIEEQQTQTQTPVDEQVETAPPPTER
ncbi:YdbH domain-containing protein [Sphingomonas lutea]|uniref:YdbH domain-containing protein n=1 Tax=Sphingomonas lutea TaxID=1045317 RepID=A0A7G9SGM6_9SPHN|nr:YdbH domain-containing protein [Sphingomonas lutea]QNN67001.1 YdbH domain-containing protein [Sphingomonas lutea]